MGSIPEIHPVVMWGCSTKFDLIQGSRMSNSLETAQIRPWILGEFEPLQPPLLFGSWHVVTFGRSDRNTSKDSFSMVRT